jgi:phenylpropionate dioxygenase-like ring-hydroxylating dioxygenase large terminal subunit
MRPRGWFRVSWSGEIGSGEVRTVRCFGRDVVVYRDTDSQALHAVDGRCQHSGAHVGVEGTVAGECIVCPFDRLEPRADELVAESAT